MSDENDSVTDGFKDWPKRYLVFGYESYYPQGGWNDHQGTYATLKEAKSATWYGDKRHIVDLSTGKIVEGAPDE